MDLQIFVDAWAKAGAAERSHKDTFLNDLADVLGVPRPDKKTGDPEKDRYVFEHDVPTAHEDGKVTTRKIDLFKHGCFILEAKQGSAAGDKRVGFARRGTPQWDIGMRDAYGQAIGYAAAMDDPPPFIVICDIGYCFDLYASFDRGTHRPFPNALTKRIFFRDLATEPKHLDTLRRIFIDPYDLDPFRHAAKVTREVAERIAKLARSLEAQKHPPALVAKFLMRCLFTMFAEDVQLLPARTFTNMIKDHWLPHPASFAGPGGVSALWQAMNDGSTAPLFGKLLRFNGGLFADTSAIPLKKADLQLLLDAAEYDWADVEPAIFGTLLERALDPKERHMLGAHFTPRAYVERLVRPTIEEPLREEWENVQAAARKLRLDGKGEEAKKLVHDFQKKLCSIRVLDPACGSGNFLHVALDLFKRIESEILSLLRELGERQELLQVGGVRVTPGQFLGIEVKPWAKEIADLVLWIGFLQWHYKSQGKGLPPPEPVLMDYKNIECRDAVLAWDKIEVVRDERGKPVTRWDGETYKKSPITGEMVPDDAAQVPVERYSRPHQAAWPRAEFIIGNPPFAGGFKIRQLRGDGYVEALWKAYPHMPEKADYVMYWWDRAADAVHQGSARRFGLITTSSVSQPFQRRVMEPHLEAERAPLRIVFAIPNHPWVDSSDAAAVRIAMTIGESATHPHGHSRIGITTEASGEGEQDASVSYSQVDSIGADLRAGVSLIRARPLRSNAGLCSPGVQLYGAGFIVDADEVSDLNSASKSRGAKILRPYLNGRDLMSRSRGAYVIDFFGMTEDEAARAHPAAFQRVLDRVKPERDHNRRGAIQRTWWRFGWERPKWRQTSQGLQRFIVTAETAKHRVFAFLSADYLPDNKLWAFALEDALFLGLLSCRAHVIWALATGGRLGVGNDPVYNKTVCFDPYPFPVCKEAQKKRIRALGETLDAHRKQQQAKHPDLTLTGMYNVLDKLRKSEALTEKDKVIHEHGLISVLKKIHDDLDAAVFDAYGWPHDLTDEQILEKLVALNAERAEEERGGLVRWLRPEFQNPAGARAATQETLLSTEEEAEAEVTSVDVKPWPKKLAEQIAAVRDRVTASARSFSVAEVAASFSRAKRKDVEDILDSLAALGVLIALDTDTGRRWKATARPA